MVSVEKTWV